MEKTLILKVTKIIHEMGIPAHLKGYAYLREAIMQAVEDANYRGGITRKLYPAIAVKFDTIPARIERAIRHAINIAWKRGNKELLLDFFGYTVDSKRGKPTNSEFIAMVADKILLEALDDSTC